MTKDNMIKVFDDTFRNVTKKIIKLDLCESREEKNGDWDEVIRHGYREMIYTHGFMDVIMVCHFSEELFHYIVNTMNGGSPPPKEEVPLYLNEYVNIVCGYAVSELNTMYRKKARVSVPHYYDPDDYLEIGKEEKERTLFLYESEHGSLKVLLYYTFQED